MGKRGARSQARLRLYLSLALLAVFNTAAKCSGITEKNLTGVATPTPVTSYDCTYYTHYYNTMDACNTGTVANCETEWKYFPNGGVQLCYKPVDGWESCATTPGTWIYTATVWCDRKIAMVHQDYESTRSIIGCSSDTCLCPDTQDIFRTCLDVGNDCLDNDGTAVHPSTDPGTIDCI